MEDIDNHWLESLSTLMVTSSTLAHLPLSIFSFYFNSSLSLFFLFEITSFVFFIFSLASITCLLFSTSFPEFFFFIFLHLVIFFLPQVLSFFCRIPSQFLNLYFRIGNKSSVTTLCSSRKRATKIERETEEQKIQVKEEQKIEEKRKKYTC